MKIESIINITENPFWISETLPYFFDGYAKDEIEIHVMYLILPFILTKSIREGILLSANSSSTFDSLFYAPSNKRKKVENNVFETFNESLFIDEYFLCSFFSLLISFVCIKIYVTKIF